MEVMAKTIKNPPKSNTMSTQCKWQREHKFQFKILRVREIGIDLENY